MAITSATASTNTRHQTILRLASPRIPTSTSCLVSQQRTALLAWSRPDLSLYCRRPERCWTSVPIGLHAQLEIRRRRHLTALRAINQAPGMRAALIGPEMTTVWATEALAATLGYEPTDFIGHSVLEFVHPGDLAVVADAIGARRELTRGAVGGPGRRATGLRCEGACPRRRAGATRMHGGQLLR